MISRSAPRPRFPAFRPTVQIECKLAPGGANRVCTGSDYRRNRPSARYAQHPRRSLEAADLRTDFMAYAESSFWPRCPVARPARPPRPRGATDDREGDSEYLVDVLAAPGPCEACPHRARCAEGLACAAFTLFVDHGGERWQRAPRHPDRYRFERMFPGDPLARAAA